jgi:hypothetical protein
MSLGTGQKPPTTSPPLSTLDSANPFASSHSIGGSTQNNVNNLNNLNYQSQSSSGDDDNFDNRRDRDTYTSEGDSIEGRTEFGEPISQFFFLCDRREFILVESRGRLTSLFVVV